jgi:O-antigen/teichoic acid export membrane protein
VDLFRLVSRWKERLFSGPAGNVFRGMATLAIGNIAARVIGIVSLPILTRLYSPEDFGVLAVFTSLISILAPVITLRYVLAMPLPRRDEMAINLMALCIGLMITMSSLVGVVLWLNSNEILSLFSMELLAPYWWLIVLGLIGSGFYEVLSFWATRKRAYSHISQTTAMQNLLGNLAKLAMGFISIKPLGLLVGQVVSSSGGTLSLWFRLREDFSINHKFISADRIKLIARRYSQFPVYRLPSQLLLVFSIQSPVLFFAAIFGPLVTGQLSMALTVTAIPLSILGNSVSKAYYAETAKIGIRNPELLITVTRSVTKKLLIASFVPFLILAFGGKHIFVFLFGENWADSGVFASMLAIYLITQFVTAPVMNIFNVLNRQAVFLAINTLRAILMVGIFIGVAPWLDLGATQTLLMYSFGMAIFYMGIYFFVIQVLNSLKR